MFHRTRGNNLHALKSSFFLVLKHRRIRSGLIVQVSVTQKYTIRREVGREDFSEIGEKRTS